MCILLIFVTRWQIYNGIIVRKLQKKLILNTTLLSISFQIVLQKHGINFLEFHCHYSSATSGKIGFLYLVFQHKKLMLGLSNFCIKIYFLIIVILEGKMFFSIHRSHFKNAILVSRINFYVSRINNDVWTSTLICLLSFLPKESPLLFHSW